MNAQARNVVQLYADLLRRMKREPASIAPRDGGFMYLLPDGRTERAVITATHLHELSRLGLLTREADGNWHLIDRSKAETPKFNDRESPLYRLFHRKERHGQALLSEPQYEAGERLRRDYEIAHFETSVTAAWSREGSGRSHQSISDNRMADLSDRALDARKRVHRAFDAVGPELSGILYFVCCLAGGLERAESYLTLPQRSGKVVLALALTRLARHYRLLKPSRPGRVHVGHWALADYRPAITPPKPDEHPT
jgi:Domain of unknown function (DUF6456)